LRNAVTSGLDFLSPYHSPCAKRPIWFCTSCGIVAPPFRGPGDERDCVCKQLIYRITMNFSGEVGRPSGVDAAGLDVVIPYSSTDLSTSRSGRQLGTFRRQSVARSRLQVGVVLVVMRQRGAYRGNGAGRSGPRTMPREQASAGRGWSKDPLFAGARPLRSPARCVWRMLKCRRNRVLENLLHRLEAGNRHVSELSIVCHTNDLSHCF
jgi:hypothetical protein